MGRFGLAATVLAATAIASGCSFIFVRGPGRSVDAYGRPVCTNSRGVPTLDLIVGAAGAAATYEALRRTDEDYRGLALSRGADIGLEATVTALYFASAFYGYASVNSCRAASREWSPYAHPLPRQTHTQRAAEEAAEEEAVQAQLKAKAAADAKAAGQAAAATTPAKERPLK